MTRVFFAVTASVVLAGCGVQSSVSGDKQISSLTSVEAQQLCRDRLTYSQNILSNTELETYRCNVRGTVAGQIAMSSKVEVCKQAFTDCMGENQPAPSLADCEDPLVPSDCMATVRSLNTCLETLVEQVRRYGQKNECDALPNIPGVTEACSALRSTCPVYPPW